VRTAGKREKEVSVTALPRNPDEQQLKQQAKELLRAYRRGDSEALRRFAAQRAIAAADPEAVPLARALFTIAREYGFPSWPQLKAYLTERRASKEQQRARTAARLARRAEREAATAERAAKLVTLTHAADAAGLAALIGRLPRRDIDAVRDHLAVHQPATYDRLISVLISGLQHRSAGVRYGCAAALDHFGDDQAIEPLRALAGDPVPRVRRMALHALSCEACKRTSLAATADPIPTLVEHALRDPSINVRRHAAYGLTTRAADPRAAAALAELRASESDPAIRRSLRRLDRAQ
jgi:hypothetical protein